MQQGINIIHIIIDCDFDQFFSMLKKNINNPTISRVDSPKTLEFGFSISAQDESTLYKIKINKIAAHKDRLKLMNLYENISAQK